MPRPAYLGFGAGGIAARRWGLALGAFARLGLDGAQRAAQPAGSEPGGAQVPRPVLAARDLQALLAPHDIVGIGHTGATIHGAPARRDA